MSMAGRQRDSEEEFGRGKRGSALVLVVLFIFVLFGFAALSLDVANVYREKHRVHMATDAGALAGVAKLGDSAAAIAEARFITNTNGVTDAEITAGPPGDIQVGLWNGSTFTANATPFNAVRVPALRTVTNHFANIGGPLGFPVMRPSVESIATIGARPIPYGVPGCVADTVPVGGTNILQNWNNVACSSSSGNWGPLDLCGTLNGAKKTEDAISGPGCFSTIGQSTGTSPGNDGVEAGFNHLCDQTIVLPVTSDFPNGNNGPVTIEDYIIVKVLCPSTGSGSGWQLKVVILGRGFNDLKKFGLGPIRVLVE